MPYGHYFVASLTILELCAAVAYYRDGYYPRCIMWVSYAIANVATLLVK